MRHYTRDFASIPQLAKWIYPIKKLDKEKNKIGQRDFQKTLCPIFLFHIPVSIGLAGVSKQSVEVSPQAINSNIFSIFMATHLTQRQIHKSDKNYPPYRHFVSLSMTRYVRVNSYIISIFYYLIGSPVATTLTMVVCKKLLFAD